MSVTHSRFAFARTAPIVAVLTAALLSGCANRDSIQVGSIPDDYRTNHPIVIAEKDQVLDLPVAASDRGMTRMQRTALQGFFSEYDRSAAPVVSIMSPSGAANDVAASHAARDFAALAAKSGVPRERVVMTQYQAPADATAAPIRVVYTAMKAQTGPCGRWPSDIADTTDNKHYANFGCSYQNNMAAQIANPADLLGPRKTSEIDATNRSEVIDVYRERGISDEFLGNSEVNY
ncbi:CpaD family pilus assembly protein [Mesorhizobium sp. SB112]|uniref:CpaD family pilus assembly protein n=1 Tax=Mesorhizobium sp. SB112 TaxID=3151853 RepID=UPI003265E26D